MPGYSYRCSFCLEPFTAAQIEALSEEELEAQRCPACHRDDAIDAINKETDRA